MMRRRVAVAALLLCVARRADAQGGTRPRFAPIPDAGGACSTLPPSAELRGIGIRTTITLVVRDSRRIITVMTDSTAQPVSISDAGPPVATAILRTKPGDRDWAEYTPEEWARARALAVQVVRLCPVRTEPRPAREERTGRGTERSVGRDQTGNSISR